MADWVFKTIHRIPSIGLNITECKPTFGDAFSPPIPTDKLCTMNWNTSGTVKLYSANMDFIAEYGPGERMMVSDPVHLGYEKAILIASSPAVEYYCLGRQGSYWTGELITLAPNETKALTGLLSKVMFVSSGSLTAPTQRDKHALVHFETTDAYEVTAGPEGSILAIVWKDPA